MGGESSLLENRIVALETELREYREAHRREHGMLDDVLQKAEVTMDRRLEGMNEFREELRKQAANFATRESVTILKEFQDKFMGLLVGVSIANALITTLIALIVTNWPK